MIEDKIIFAYSVKDEKTDNVHVNGSPKDVMIGLVRMIKVVANSMNVDFSTLVEYIVLNEKIFDASGLFKEENK